jgi:hypothetical protein
MIVRDGKVIGGRGISHIASFPDAEPEVFQACEDAIADLDLEINAKLVLLGCVAFINIKHWRATGEAICWPNPDQLLRWLADYVPKTAKRLTPQQVGRIRDELWKSKQFIRSHRGELTEGVRAPSGRLLIDLKALEAEQEKSDAEKKEG